MCTVADLGALLKEQPLLSQTACCWGSGCPHCIPEAVTGTCPSPGTQKLEMKGSFDFCAPFVFGTFDQCLCGASLWGVLVC